MASTGRATIDDCGRRTTRRPRPRQAPAGSRSSRRWSATAEIDTLIVAITDMQGRLMGKRVQGQAFLDGVIDHGAHFCTYLLGTDMEMNTPEGFALMNWETGYGDWIAEPVWDSSGSCRGCEKTAMVLADAIDEETGAEIPVAPRTILKRQVARAAEAGLRAQGRLGVRVLRPQGLVGGARPSAAGRSRSAFGHYNEDYHLLQATKAEPLHRLLRNQMTEAADSRSSSARARRANGQHEVNIRYDHVLESADRSVVFKHGAKEIAYLNGWGITFMAKPDHRWTGSSGHLHMSLWDVGKDVPLMHDAEAAGGPVRAVASVRPAFVAGMMKLSRELAVFIAPFINSYKRYASLSWAPVNVVWGRDNRTTGFRLVGHGAGLHVEDRFPGRRHERLPDLRGDDRAPGCTASSTSCTLDPEFKGNGYLATGVRADAAGAVRGDRASSRRSEAAVEIFGQDVVDHYLNAARVEQETYDSVVHAWERERYLERG